MTAPMMPQPGAPQQYAQQPAAPQAPGYPQPQAPAMGQPASPPAATNAVNWQELVQQAGEGGFQPLPNGDYDCVVASAEKTVTASGKTMYKVKFRVVAGPQANKLVYNNFVLSPESPGALNFFFRHMAVLGLDHAYFMQNPPPEQVATDLVGRACKLRLTTKEYPAGSKEYRNEVDSVMQATPGIAAVAGQPMTPSPQPMTPAPVMQPPQPQYAQPAPAPAPVQQPAPVPQPAPVQQQVPVQPQPSVAEQVPAYPQPAPVPQPPVVAQPVAPAPPVVDQQPQAGAPAAPPATPY